MFLSDTEPNNHNAGNWINRNADNQTIDQVSKVTLLLKLYFDHWSSIESGENIQRFYRSMEGRLTGLGHRGLYIVFSNHNNNYLQNLIDTHSCFNQLIFHAVDRLLSDVLTSCNRFSNNLNFHDNSESFALD